MQPECDIRLGIGAYDPADPIDWRVTVVSAPAVEPVTLAEMWTHLRLTPTGSPEATSEDDLIEAAVTAARVQCEETCGRALITTSLQLWLSRWPRGRTIRIPRAPLLAVSAVAYTDQAGDAQTLSSALYAVEAPAGPTAGPGEVILADGQSWPSLALVRWPVKIAFTAGYGAAATAVPAGIRSWIKLAAANLYQHRETQVIGASSVSLGFVDKLLSAYLVGTQALR